jgi:hypothetical protein
MLKGAWGDAGRLMTDEKHIIGYTTTAAAKYTREPQGAAPRVTPR